MTILMQYDPCFGDFSNAPVEEIVAAFFYDIDQKGCKPDVILWEQHRLLPGESPENQREEYDTFCRRGIDIMRILIAECRKRGIQPWLHHRFSEVVKDWNKAAPAERQEWRLETWCEGGLWNAAHPGVRRFKTEYLKGILEAYNFDGLCIDFLRHLPCLSVGQQWEHRGAVTELLAGLRQMTDSLGRKIQLGAKVSENFPSCKIDGFDVETWCERGIVDFLIPGSRSIHPDVAGFAAMGRKHGVFIYPCWDTWHSSDAHHWQPDAFYRGVFANWMDDGADGIVSFNYNTAPHAILQKLLPEGETCWGTREFSDFYGQLTSAGDAALPHTFAAERRGGYPYSVGAGSSNFLAPLPLELPNASTAGEVPIAISSLGEGKKGALRLLLSGAGEKDGFRLWLNGTELCFMVQTVTDPQIHWPRPQIASGAGYCDIDDPAPLTELTAEIPEGLLRRGNTITLLPVRRGFHQWHETITIQRVEVRV